jgi:hypothetical protein
MKFYKNVRRPSKYTGSIRKKTPKKAKKKRIRKSEKLIDTGDKKAFVQRYNV